MVPMHSEPAKESFTVAFTPSSSIMNNDKDHDMGQVSPIENINSEENGDLSYVAGLRLTLITIVIALTYFITIMDMSVVSPVLITIAQNIGGFEFVSWIITSYLLGYIAIIVIFSKMSDILGRKTVFLGSIVTFTIFSAGCAAAQTMLQLAILRAFQGIGGGGSYALAFILTVEAVPPQKVPNLVAATAFTMILALVVGPLIGAAIGQNTTWRWIFIISVILGVVVFAAALVGIPNGFPHHGRPPKEKPAASSPMKTLLERSDLLGAVLLLLATLSFVAVFEEAGSRFPWRSAFVVTLLIISVLLWGSLLAWERHVTQRSTQCDPVLPWRFITNRAMAGILLVCSFLGPPMIMTIFQLPSRFRLVNGLPSFDAGARILPYGAGALLSLPTGGIIGKAKIPGLYVILVGSVLQIIGYALLSQLDGSVNIKRSVYVYQALIGLGASMNLQILNLLVPSTVESRDRAVGMGAITQVRSMGSAVGVAIGTSVFNGYISSPLEALGLVDPLSGLATGDLSMLSATMQAEAREILSEGYNRQMLVALAFASAQVPAALLIWRREQILTS
ncbi:putative multidrug resistance protein fnx1 [Rostrohypoxylon terebratum]|nr:putative multidrug resistance protein fnx1 [Rostrohypoxylon terebratum]